MYAVKFDDATYGKLEATLAGMDAKEEFPVARQSPPQYGRSFDPVMTRTGPAKLLAMVKEPRVRSSPGVTGCLVFSAKVRMPGLK